MHRHQAPQYDGQRSYQTWVTWVKTVTWCPKVQLLTGCFTDYLTDLEQNKITEFIANDKFSISLAEDSSEALHHKDDLLGQDVYGSNTKPRWVTPMMGMETHCHLKRRQWTPSSWKCNDAICHRIICLDNHGCCSMTWEDRGKTTKSGITKPLRDVEYKI